MRRRGVNGEEFILKKVRSDLNELKILEYLRTIEPSCKYIVRLVETVSSNIGTCIVLPKRHSVDLELRLFPDYGSVRGRLIEFSRNLLEGLSFLHEHKIAHLDIKPRNLVYTDDFLLQIIDFDIAVQLADINDQIDEYCGTKDWMAPEIGEENGPRHSYSPILADKWSCGRVLAILRRDSGRTRAVLRILPDG